MSILKQLLIELLKVADLNAETMVKSCDLAALTPEALFAVLLYHRWYVQVFFYTILLFISLYQQPTNQLTTSYE